MEAKDAIELVQAVNQLALNVKAAYGKRLGEKQSTNPYIIAARAKMEAYMEVESLIKEMSR